MQRVRMVRIVLQDFIVHAGRSGQITRLMGADGPV